MTYTEVDRVKVEKKSETVRQMNITQLSTAGLVTVRTER